MALGGSGTFSESGDSGSCIWSLDGRVAGLIGGGSGNAAQPYLDLTYADSIEWILEDIRKEYLDAELL